MVATDGCMTRCRRLLRLHELVESLEFLAVLDLELLTINRAQTRHKVVIDLVAPLSLALLF